MDQHDIAYVAVAPPEALGEDLLKRVASLVGKELFETRLLLAGEIPGIIASCPDTDTADSMAQNLRNEGLAAFVCRESELRSRSAGFAAHTAHVGQKEVIFQDRHGGEVRIEEGDAFLIMRGKTRSAARQMTSTIKMKLNVPATVLAGGIPIIRPVTKKTIQEGSLAEDFVRIFDRRSSDPRVEMSQSRVNYSFLGPELASSAPMNFRIVVTKLREWFPLAIFDERLTCRFKTDMPAAGPEEALEIKSKLIYLCHLAEERRGGTGMPR